MASNDEFAQACRDASKGLRRVQKDLRRELSQQSKEKVAVPLAAKVARAAAGPWARTLASGTKARAGADPTIVIGGMRPKVSGGAGPRALIYGTEFGGGSRLNDLAGSPRRHRHRRHTTAQFRRNMHPFVFRTISANVPWVLDTFADITMTTLDKEVNR